MIFAVTNRKGGATKTTVAVNLAAVIAETRQVLLVDLDEQGDASEYLGVGGSGRELASALTGKGELNEAIRLSPYRVHVAVGGEALSRLDGLLDPYALRLALHRLDQPYDIVIVDCPPRLDGSVKAGWLASDEVTALVPVDGPEALRATVRMENAWRDLGLEVEALRFVITRHNPRRLLDQALAAQATELGDGRILATRIRETVAVRESAGWRKPLSVYAPGHPVVEDFRALAEEVLHG